MASGGYWDKYARRRYSRRSVLRVAAAGAAGLTALGLVGCGDGTGQGEGGAGGPAGGGFSGIQFRGVEQDFNLPPKAGGRLNISYVGTPPHLDNGLTSSAAMYAVVAPAHNRLVRGKYGPELQPFDPFRFEPTGDLAREFSATPDLLEYRFTLHDGIKWHNVDPVNGRDFTAEDVKYTYERYAASGLLTLDFEDMDRIEVPDPKTVVIKMKQPNPDFLLQPLSHNQTMILAREVAEADGDYKRRNPGTGPFVMAQYEPGQQARFERNPAYFLKDANGTQLPYLDGFDLKLGLDRGTALNAYRAGQLDFNFASVASDEEADSLLRDVPTTSFYALDNSFAVYHLAFQMARGPFQDVRVRRAISMGIDRARASRAMSGGREPNDLALQALPWPEIFDEAPTLEDLGPYYQYNPSEAKKLLEGAGYGNGLTVSIDYFPYNEYHSTFVEVVAQQLRDIGVTVQLQRGEYTSYYQKFSSGEYEGMALGFVPASAQSMDAFTYQSFYSTSPRNVWTVKDAQLDQLLAKQRREIDPEARRAIFKQIWDRLLDQVYTIALPGAGTVWYYYASKIQDLLNNRLNIWPHYGGQMAEVIWVRQ